MSLLLRNPGYVACMVGIEKTAAGVGFYWLDQPDSVGVKEGDRVELTVQHNQTSGVALAWQQASDGLFETDVITLAAITNEIGGVSATTLVIEEVKVARFPKPVRNGNRIETYPRFYRCAATHSGTVHYSDVASVSVGYEIPKKPEVGEIDFNSD